ncbi:MAG: YhcH/YjgK/YiaL family protein [Daejeonella sp.]|uniref:YhcH/YjgK/YiaL family protein n=1 Tax=Daejeonella sp. TaxID=2805397 RepID=UPI002735C2F9|nr:YhcH/YjgK/YiaL family protein [Daejeonella sp.]MDP3468705.1 YhcH/YjgK/YiaL family protein [Daejeonella sp.]
MIIDTLENAGKYTSVHPLFAKAFEFLNSIDLKQVEAGKYEISEGLNYVVVEKEGMTAEESIAKFECHNKNIDIQLCISGKEKLGWKPRNSCKSLKGEYNSEKDVLFYNDTPDTYFELTDNQFAIFFPEDVHAPMIADGIIKKLIVKVRL